MDAVNRKIRPPTNRYRIDRLAGSPFEETFCEVIIVNLEKSEKAYGVRKFTRGGKLLHAQFRSCRVLMS